VTGEGGVAGPKALTGLADEARRPTSGVSDQKEEQDTAKETTMNGDEEARARQQ
jgi:hypothetical protein